jgi:hypothetical protein
MQIARTAGDDGAPRLDAVVDRYLSALNDTDIESIISMLTTDVEHEQVGAVNDAVHGIAAVRTRFLQQFVGARFERDVPLRRLYGSGFVVDERIWEGQVTGHIGHIDTAGRRVSQRVLHVFEMRGERVARVTVYQDLAAVVRQLS